MLVIPLRRPKLHKIDLKKALNDIMVPGFHITMSMGQWDNFLAEAYFHQNATLIELNSNEIPIAAYRLEKETELHAE